jgi:hypothetical protein
MRRREFLELSSCAVVATVCDPLRVSAASGEMKQPVFPSGDGKWRRTWDAAVAALAGNTKRLNLYDKPVMIEGAEYPGIWLECAPLEGLVYAGLSDFLPQGQAGPSPAAVARANHMAFFALQREDGQLPAYIWTKEAGFGQIQMVVPIAATAWELAQATKDEELTAKAYAACSRWDAWLRRYRDTRKTGLVEGFCCYDTGHDNSPRWKGMPDACPDGDARKCAPIHSLPRLCPDLSATVYGGRVALAAMAQALGKRTDAERWSEEAESIRLLIVKKLYCAEDGAFYDVDAQNQFVKVRGDLMSRVLGEHVLKVEAAEDRKIFDEVWTRQMHNPAAFWTAYPFPSIALNDPAFVRPIPPNSWGGAAQALTALRAPRWMKHYGKQQELATLMRQWVTAINASGEKAGNFWQQMNPETGEFTPGESGGYSPAALVYLDFVRRLGGIFLVSS